MTDHTLAIAHSTQAIAAQIAAGRARAHAKHGDNSIEAVPGEDIARWLPILLEEVGEAAHELTYDAGSTRAKLRAELLDVATVTVAWIAALDRGAPDHRPEPHAFVPYEYDPDAGWDNRCKLCGEPRPDHPQVPVKIDGPHRCIGPSSSHPCNCGLGADHDHDAHSRMMDAGR